MIGSDVRETAIALVDTDDREEGFANVRLILSAPKLLAACASTVNLLESLNGELSADGPWRDRLLQILRSAIRQATEESNP